MVWSCLPFIRSGQNHFARHSERRKKKKRWDDNIREWTGLDVRQVPEGSGEPGKMEETGCEVICDTPTTLAVKGLVKVEVKSRRKVEC